MKKLFINKDIFYTGKELTPHWIYKNFNLIGDAIVAFLGECSVPVDNMVDISDVLSNSPIYSKKMLHLIVEHFNIELIEGILRQRILTVIAREEILAGWKAENPEKQNLPEIQRTGDDLFLEGGKLSVSIATKSTNSVLIHLGININSKDAPVKAAGLSSELNLENCSKIAENILNSYCKECDNIIEAGCKVRGV